MPAWPTATDYQAALQHPAQAFRDPRLQGARAETNRLGLPRARSGQFAIVYKLVSGGTATAVRVFRDPQPGRQERYQLISDHLQRARPPSLVGFAYDPEGIRVGGQRLPVVTMEWVDGPTLGEWVAERVRQREAERLGQMAARWAGLVAGLRAAQVAHGDLQHDNVLVVRDVPRLVDYDGLCVPRLVGQPALEHGKPAYQHPRRRDQALSLGLDRFGAWVIFLALRALADDLTLWEQFVTAGDNENLLFTEADHQGPDASPLWRRLLAARSPRLRGWALQLRACLPDRPFEQIPEFEPEALPVVTVPVPRTATVPPALVTRVGPKPGGPVQVTGLADGPPRSRLGPDAPAAEDFGEIFGSMVSTVPDIGPGASGRGGTALIADLFKPLRDAVRVPPIDWDLVHQLLTQPPLAQHAPPADLRATAEEAYARVGARARLSAAVASRDPRRVVAAYEARWLDDWPACAALVAEVRQAQEQLQILADLEAARQAPGDGRRLVAMWGRHGADLVALAEAAPIAHAAQEWARRLRACDHFLAQVTRPDAAERDIASAWSALVQLGGHPDAARYRLRAEEAEARLACLERLRALPPEETEDNDRLFCQAWDEALLQGCAEAAALRPRYDAARRRLEQLNRLQQVLAALPPGGDEAAVLAAAAGLPAGYRHRFLARVEQARLRVKYRGELERALEATPRSDVALASAWEKALAQGSLLLPRAAIEQCQLAVRRRNCLRALKAIDASLPADVQDAEWLRLWDEALLESCADAAAARKRYRLARERIAAWQALEAVLAAGDLRRARAAAGNRLLKDYPPLLRRRAEVDDLLERTGRLERCLALLERGDPSAFVNGADLQFVRDNPGLFAEQRARIEELVRQWLLGEVRLAAGDPPYVTAGDGSRVVVRWTWPYFGRVTHCRVTVHPARFFATPEEALTRGKVGAGRLTADDHRRAGGLAVALAPERLGNLYVTVWPAVDLGWTELLGPPLKVGPVTPKRGR